MEFLEVLQNRRSIRKYTGEPIADEKVDMIVRSAMVGASGHNFRPWEFIVVRDKEMLKKLSIARETGSAKMLDGADAAIVVMGSPEASEMWVEDCSVCMTNMYLTAEELGVGACWIQVRGRMFDETTTTEDYIRSLLGFPESLKVESMMSLGMPNAHPKAKLLSDAEMEKVHYEKY